jgi:hypothetical protein
VHGQLLRQEKKARKVGAEQGADANRLFEFVGFHYILKILWVLKDYINFNMNTN